MLWTTILREYPGAAALQCTLSGAVNADLMTNVDVEKFRLRRFVDNCAGMNEVEVHEEPIDLIDLSAAIEATGKATLFKAVGPERQQVVAAVSGSRRRIAAAFETDERNLAGEVMSRLGKPQPVIEVEFEGRAGPCGRAHRRSDRSHHPAVSPAARGGRRALHLLGARFHDRSRFPASAMSAAAG